MQFAITQSAPRTEDPRLLRGGGSYADDFQLAGQVYAAFVRSPHAHAEINKIDPSAALAMSGVMRVLTGADWLAAGLGDMTGPSPHKRRDGKPMYRPPRPALTSDRVRHLGQPVAMIIAQSAAIARDAVELVEVDYTPLEFVISTADATLSTATQLWEDCANNESFVHRSGDRAAVDAAFARAAHVVSRDFDISRVHALPMEPRAALAEFHAGQGRYTIYTGCQRPYAWRSNLAGNIFDVPEHDLVLISGDVGGSFGMKGSIHPEVPLVAWAARVIARPVKWTSDRSESFVADDHARDNVCRAKLALAVDGEFLGLRVRTNADLGAYVAFMGGAPPTGNLGTLAGQYRTPAIDVEVVGVLTNRNPTSPYRGAGRPEAAYLIERMVHIAAVECGFDPIELRQRNFIRPEQMPFKTGLTFTYDSGEFPALLDKGLLEADYAGFAARRAHSAKRAKLRGIGISCTIESAASPQPETAELRFDPRGNATVLVGSTPHGQGHETIFKQIIGDRLGLDSNRIRVIEGDTDKVSFGTGTGGSRTATIGGSAVLGAIDKVIAKGTQVAAHLLEAAASDIEFVQHEYRVAGTDRSLSFREVAIAAFNHANLPEGLEPGLYEFATFSPKTANFPNGCQLCEVEIDPDTGVTELVRYTVVSDVGVEINPLLVRGQMHGGVAQGAGQALMEKLSYDDDSGQLITGSFMDYCMPRADDFCELQVHSRPVPTATNPLGVKGAGESGTVGSIAAVMNAIHDALAECGVRHLDMPATPMRVWQAIQAARP